MKYTLLVSDLRKALEGVPDDFLVSVSVPVKFLDQPATVVHLRTFEILIRPEKEEPRSVHSDFTLVCFDTISSRVVPRVDLPPAQNPRDDKLLQPPKEKRF